jgi:hypothetical protein
MSGIMAVRPSESELPEGLPRNRNRPDVRLSDNRNLAAGRSEVAGGLNKPFYWIYRRSENDK